MSCKIKFSFCCCFFFFNSNIENLTDDLNHFFPLVSSPRRIHKIYAIRMGVFCSNNKLRKKIQMHNRCMTLNSHFELSAFASICFIASFSLINNKNIRMHAKESIIEWTPSTCNRFAVRFVQLSLLKYNSLEHFFFLESSYTFEAVIFWSHNMLSFVWDSSSWISSRKSINFYRQ